MVERLGGLITGERLTALLGYIVGAVIGTQVAEGGMSVSDWLWSGIALLCVIQLRLLTMPQMIEEPAQG